MGGSTGGRGKITATKKKIEKSGLVYPMTCLQLQEQSAKQSKNKPSVALRLNTVVVHRV